MTPFLIEVNLLSLSGSSKVNIALFLSTFWILLTSDSILSTMLCLPNLKARYARTTIRISLSQGPYIWKMILKALKREESRVDN